MTCGVGIRHLRNLFRFCIVLPVQKCFSSKLPVFDKAFLDGFIGLLGSYNVWLGFSREVALGICLGGDLFL